MLHEMADWLFIKADKQKVIGLVPADNLKAIKLNRHIGFKEVYRISEGFAEGVDYILMQLNREDCKYLSEQLRRAA